MLCAFTPFQNKLNTRIKSPLRRVDPEEKISKFTRVVACLKRDVEPNAFVQTLNSVQYLCPSIGTDNSLNEDWPLVCRLRFAACLELTVIKLDTSNISWMYGKSFVLNYPILFEIP